jgi:hypothetical protein
MLEGLSVFLKDFRAVGMVEGRSFLQKAVEFHPGNAKQLGSLEMRERTGPVSLDCRRFQSLAPRVGTIGQIVRERTVICMV